MAVFVELGCVKCERCTTGAHVGPHGVDGYVGYVCDRWRERWDRLCD